MAAIQEEEELETKVCNADMYQTTLEERIVFLEEFFKQASQQPPLPMPRGTPNELFESTNLVSSTPYTPTHESEAVEKPIATTHESNETAHTDSTYQNYSRLPRLTLLTFSWNPLQWQTFWDSFSAAVKCNPHLSGVQKLNHLRTQVQGDAAHIIDGFPLTDINYTHSVELLKEKYGQNYKLVNTHMDALLNVPAPSHNLTRLQSFHNTIQIN